MAVQKIIKVIWMIILVSGGSHARYLEVINKLILNDVQLVSVQLSKEKVMQISITKIEPL